MDNGTWWWAWLVLGLLLLVAEVAVPGGFFLMFFGASALVTGGLVGLGVVGPLWLQLVLFAVLATVALLAFRRRLLARFRVPVAATARIEAQAMSEAVLLEDLPAGGTGRAEMQGTTWNATNTGGGPLTRGERVTVARVEGLTLLVTKGTPHV